LLIIQERVGISQIFQLIWIQQVKSNFLSKEIDIFLVLTYG
jgi:hypothetical protein